MYDTYFAAEEAFVMANVIARLPEGKTETPFSVFGDAHPGFVQLSHGVGEFLRSDKTNTTLH